MLHIESFLIKFTGAAVCLAAALLFIIPFSLGIKNIGNIFGLTVSLILFIYFAFNKHVSALFDHMWKNSIGKTFVSSVVIFFGLGFVTALILSVFMTKSMFDKPDKAYPAVLLGCKVNGSSPSLMLSRRLKAAYTYLSENEDAVIIVSGGQGEEEEISEAECMKKYLIDKGISEQRIIEENQSTNTYENLNFSKKILEEKELGKHIVIITDSFHQFRASLIAGKLGLETDSINSHTPPYLIATYWVREWFGIIQQIFLK